jgi:crotonobetainyl-CoA:carnitine CoA-transferase CaiB-like acyl-CoA transferase
MKNKLTSPLKFPFQDLKIIELASVLAGPAVGMFFAELGAEVIKIENKNTGGDVTRSWKLPTENKKEKTSAYFHAINYGKQHLFLNIKENKDYEQLIQLVKTADIIISNFKKGDDKKLKVDFETLKKINNKLIYGNITGFGENSNRVAFDLVLQAESGFMSMNGTEQSGPLKMPVALIDLLAAHQLKEGLLTALLQREKTGQGLKVSVSLLDSAIASLANQASNWLIGKQLPTRTGSLHPNIAPYGEIFKTKDQFEITLAIGSESQFKDLCLILKITILKIYENNTSRVKNRMALFKIIQEKISQKNLKWLMMTFGKAQIPYGQIKNIQQVFADSKMNSHLLPIDIIGQKKVPKTARFVLSK